MRWFNCLTAQGVTSLEEVTQRHCTAYLQHRCAGRSTHDAGTGSAQFVLVQDLQELAAYAELFTTDRYRGGFHPWAGQFAHEVTGVAKRGAENKTARRAPKSWPRC